MATRCRHGGFTLIEVLIAVLVLSLGLLGLAGLQFTSLQFNHSAYMRSQATSLAYDMTDRLRANRAAARAGAYDGQGFVATQCAEAFVPDQNQPMAIQDMQGWRNDLACLLPNGQGSILRDQRSVTVTVRWNDTRNGDIEDEDFFLTFSIDTEL